MSDDIAPTTEQAQELPQKFDNFEDAMKALSDDAYEAVEEAVDTTEEHQPEDADEEDIDEEESEQDEPLDDESDSEDGDDAEEDIHTIDYDPSVRVTLDDGTESTLEDLVRGNLRQSDYTRKTEALAEERREFEDSKSAMQTQSEEIQRTYNGLVEFLQGIMPPEPSLELLGQDQSEYLRQQAIRKQFTDELSDVLQRQTQASTQIQSMEQAELEQLRSTEQKKLLDVMPMLSDEMRLASFNEGVTKTAQEFGFSEAEISAVFDHRLLHLVHMAGVGKRSIENGKNARRRIESKTATPAEKQPSKTAARRMSANGKAMRKLSQSGSIEDAMLIDFN